MQQLTMPPVCGIMTPFAGAGINQQHKNSRTRAPEIFADPSRLGDINRWSLQSPVSKAMIARDRRSE
jgi:hypothetical protein